MFLLHVFLLTAQSWLWILVNCSTIAIWNFHVKAKLNCKRGTAPLPWSHTWTPSKWARSAHHSNGSILARCPSKVETVTWPTTNSSTVYSTPSNLMSGSYLNFTRSKENWTKVSKALIKNNSRKINLNTHLLSHRRETIDSKDSQHKQKTLTQEKQNTQDFQTTTCLFYLSLFLIYIWLKATILLIW